MHPGRRAFGGFEDGPLRSSQALGQAGRGRGPSPSPSQSAVHGPSAPSLAQRGSCLRAARTREPGTAVATAGHGRAPLACLEPCRPPAGLSRQPAGARTSWSVLIGLAATGEPPQAVRGTHHALTRAAPAYPPDHGATRPPAGPSAAAVRPSRWMLHATSRIPPSRHQPWGSLRVAGQAWSRHSTGGSGVVRMIPA